MKMPWPKLVFGTLLGILQFSLNTAAYAEKPRWDLRPRQAHVFFSRDESGKAQRSNAPSVLLNQNADRLIAVDDKSVFAYNVEQKTEVWRFVTEEPLDLSWLNQEKWILVRTKAFYLVVDAASGNIIYHSNHYDRFIVRGFGATTSLVAVESYGATSGALRLHFITFSEDGTYFDAYEDLFLPGTIWLRDLAIDEIQGRVYLLASNVENNMIQDAWLKAFDIGFEENTRLIVSIAERELKMELDGGANRITANGGRLAIGGDIHSQKVWFYDSSGSRFDVATFTAGTSNLLFSRQEDLLFANGGEQTYNRSELSDLVIFDLESKSLIRKLKVPAFGPTRTSRFVSSFSVAQNKIAISLIDGARSYSGSEHEPIVPAIVVLEFPKN